MAAISQTIFSGWFSWMKRFVLWLKSHWSLFPRAQLTITQRSFREYLGAKYATSHYLNQCWPDSLMYICGTRGRWLKQYSAHALKDTTSALNNQTTQGKEYSGFESRPDSRRSDGNKFNPVFPQEILGQNHRLDVCVLTHQSIYITYLTTFCGNYNDETKQPW